MKSIILILIIVAAVYAVDDDSEQNVETQLVRLNQLFKEIIGKLEEKEGDEIDSKSASKEFEAFFDVVNRRPKRSWAERKEKKRLIEIDALVGKLWADKEKQAHDEATDTPVTEQEEQSDTEHEVKAPRRNGARPRFESSSEHPHDSRKSGPRKNERKQTKMDKPKTAKHEEVEEYSGEHSVRTEKADDTEKVSDVPKEVRNRKLEKPKKTFTKNQRKEESDKDHSTESVNENADASSAESDLEDSSSAIPRKLTGSVESHLVESELATDAPQESLVSDSAPPTLPAPVDPATATSDSKSIASDDASSVDSVHSDPIATASPVLAASEDSIPDVPADSVLAAPADPVLAAASNPVSVVSTYTAPATSVDSDPIASEDPTSSASTGAPDDVADEEETSARPVISTNVDQTRLKRQVSLVTEKESAKDGKTPKQVKQKPTGLLDHLVAAANSTASRKQKSNNERKSKAPAEDRTDQRNGSETKKGEEKKLKSEKKDEQTNIKADKDDSGKAQNTSATHLRTDARTPIKQQVPVPLTSDVEKTGSGDMKQARILQRKYKSQSVATTSPKNGKTNAKKPSASATHGVPNGEKTLAASEADSAV